MKAAAGIIAIALTFVGYLPYIRDTLRGKTKPHIYTWFVWALVTAIAFALQISGGGGIGSFVTLAAAIVCGVIFLLGLRNGEKDIVAIDKVCFALALVAVAVWVFAKQPVVSILMVSFADMISFVPTIRKSWKKPYQETLFSYEMNTFRFILAFYALREYSIVTYLYPLTWIFANGLFSIYLIIRRRKVSA